MLKLLNIQNKDFIKSNFENYRNKLIIQVNIDAKKQDEKI